jgi:hypothetical protein
MSSVYFASNSVVEKNNLSSSSTKLLTLTISHKLHHRNIFAKTRKSDKL